MLWQTNPGETMLMGSTISAIPSTGQEDQKNSESNTSPRSRNLCCLSQARETLTRDQTKWRIWFQNLDRRLVCTRWRVQTTLSTLAWGVRSTSRGLMVPQLFSKTG